MMTTRMLDDATKQLMSNLRINRRNLTIIQRKDTYKEKLLERGEFLIINKIKPEKGDASGSNVGPNSESRVTKRPRSAFATPPLA